MSCSVAIVTTPTGIGTSLTNKKNAIICDFDDVVNMIAGIQQLIDNEDFRLRLAKNGFRFAKDFVWKKQIHKLEQRYEQWLVQ